MGKLKLCYGFGFFDVQSDLWRGRFPTKSSKLPTSGAVSNEIAKASNKSVKVSNHFAEASNIGCSVQRNRPGFQQKCESVQPFRQSVEHRQQSPPKSYVMIEQAMILGGNIQ